MKGFKDWNIASIHVLKIFDLRIWKMWIFSNNMLYALGFGKLLLLLADILLVSTDQCKSGIFHVNPDKLNRKLEGYNLKIRTFENISPRGCFDQCMRRPRCHSYNYNRHLLRCELNHKPNSDSLNNFQNEVGYIYVEVNHYRGVSITPTWFYRNNDVPLILILLSIWLFQVVMF